MVLVIQRLQLIQQKFINVLVVLGFSKEMKLLLEQLGV
jgi:hypothetical protein